MTSKSDAKFEEKLTCCLENDIGIWQIFTRALESVKTGTLMGSFCPKQKIYEELCVTTMKNDTKIEEELTCPFKIDMRNLTNLHPSTPRSKTFVF